MAGKKEASKSKVRSVLFAVVLAILMLSLVSASFSNWFNTITGRAVSQSVSLNISISNTAPTVTSVTAIAAQNPTEDSVTTIYLNFTANDTDGFNNLKDASARANFTATGEPVRQNLTCNKLNTFASLYANYTCAIQMQYFDLATNWTVRVSINDTSNAVGANQTVTFNYNELSAFISHPASITFNSLSPGSVNQTPTNTPLILNNTGNRAITVGNVQMNATDLVGETDNTKSIYANNFTVSNATSSSAECDLSVAKNASRMSKAVFQAVNHSTLGRGNHTINDGTTGQEQLYMCILQLGNELSSQAYSTANQGAWTVKII